MSCQMSRFGESRPVRLKCLYPSAEVFVLNLLSFSLLMRLYVNRLYIGLGMNGRNIFSLWVISFSVHVLKYKYI